MLEWLAMGGHWAYLWPAYAIALGGLAFILASALCAHAEAAKAERQAGPDARAR